MKQSHTNRSIERKIEKEKRIVESLSNEDLISALVKSADKYSQSKYNDESKNHELKIRELLRRGNFEALVLYIVGEEVKDYLKRFPREYYVHIWRLHGWVVKKDSFHQKPWIVGTITNQIIYGRFPPSILHSLKQKNPYIGRGYRHFKHFQFLTEVGETELHKYIIEAISTMKECTTWREFEHVYADKYHLPLQSNLQDLIN